MKNIKTRIEWLGINIIVPEDIELRFNTEPRRIWIEMIPHSHVGERFAYQASENMKLNLILAYLSEREYFQCREAELKIKSDSKQPF